MSNTFLLPDLGEGLTEADIVRWLVAEGDTVAVDHGRRQPADHHRRGRRVR